MSPKRKDGELCDIRDVLEDVLTTEGFKRPYSRICVNWDNIVGEKVARNASPSRLRNRILYVKVKNPSWANELSFLKPDIMKAIEEVTGPGKVLDIVFRTS